MLEDNSQYSVKFSLRIFPSEAMLWIKEVEMVDSLEDLKSSRSASGKSSET